MSSSDFSQTGTEDFDDLADSSPSSPPARAITESSNLHPVDMTSDLMSSLTKLSSTSGDKRVDGQPVKPTTTEQSTPILASDLSSTYKRHDRFYFDDGNITFLVEDVLYSVHRYFFCRDSAYFVDLIMNRLIPKGGNSSIPFSAPFVLDDVKGAEFDALLCILYPLNFNECELKTVESWTAVLRLATKWSLSSIRKLAISRLEPIASPVDKVVLGRTYCVNAWLLPGFIAICQRHQPLTRDEGRRLGVDDAVLVACLRESVLVCSTKPSTAKPTTDGISTMVRACLASSDIVDKGPIPIAVSKAPSARCSRAATPPETKHTNPSQPKPAQAPPSKDTNSGPESSNSVKTVPTASPPDAHLDPSNSSNDTSGPSETVLGTGILEVGAVAAKDAAKDTRNSPPSSPWTRPSGECVVMPSVSPRTPASNPWAKQPKWAKALSSLSAAAQAGHT